jgi:hypothetical protein
MARIVESRAVRMEASRDDAEWLPLKRTIKLRGCHLVLLFVFNQCDGHTANTEIVISPLCDVKFASAPVREPASLNQLVESKRYPS